MTTVKELIKELQKIKPSLQDKDVYVLTENRMLVSPSIRFALVDSMKPLDKSKENISYIVIEG